MWSKCERAQCDGGSLVFDTHVRRQEKARMCVGGRDAYERRGRAMEPFASKCAGAVRARTRFRAGAVLVSALGAALQTFTLNASASFVADEPMSGRAIDVASPFVGLCETYEAIPERGHRFWNAFEHGVET